MDMFCKGEEAAEKSAYNKYRLKVSADMHIKQVREKALLRPRKSKK
jgi:hypothetical protein